MIELLCKFGSFQWLAGEFILNFFIIWLGGRYGHVQVNHEKKLKMGEEKWMIYFLMFMKCFETF